MEEKIKRLKHLVSEYETMTFLRHISLTIARIGERETSSLFKNLLSPHRQLFYLASLYLETKQTGKKGDPTEDEWNEITELLRDIEWDYCNHISFFDDINPIDKKETEKILVALPTFMNYFFNGSFSYLEQIIERVESTFNKYSQEIVSEFGLSVSDFITCFKFIENEVNANLNAIPKLINSGEWEKFTSEMTEKGLDDPKDWTKELPDKFIEALNFFSKPGDFFKIDLRCLKNEIELVKIQSFLKLFACSKNIKESILYYTEINCLLKQPIYKIDNHQYFVFNINQILTAIYNKLYDFCNTISNGKVHIQRDNLLERKTLAVFKQFFGKNASYFTSYNIDGGPEQDLLIIYKSLVLIIEIKACNNREPLRDPNRAYDRIKSDFKKSIQYAYDQSLRVESRFWENKTICIYNKKKQLLHSINPKRINNFYSIIVTLDRFGVVQSDLEHLLKIDEDNVFPWAVNIDDLEIFLLMLMKRKGKVHELITFLSNRELLHGHCIADDELDICCMFYKKPKLFIQHCMAEETIVFHGDWTNVVETLYRKGLGFKNERYINEKKDESVLSLFG